MESKENLLNMGITWNKIIIAKAQKQEPGDKDMQELVNILAQNGNLLKKIIQNQNEDRQEPK